MGKLKKIIIIGMLLLLSSPGTVLAQKILYSDSFTGVNGQRPQNWEIIDAPDPAYWYLQDGQLCSGNGDNLLIPGGHSYAIVRLPGSEQWANYAIECSAWMLQRNGRIILVGRWLDKNNHYQGVLECYEEKRVLKIIRVQNGAQTLLVRAVHGVENVNIPAIERGSSPADSKYFQLRFLNDELTFTYDKLTIRAKDGTFTKGSGGLGQWYNYLFFDNFVVKEISGEVAIARPVSKVPTLGVKVEEKAILPQAGITAPVYQLVIARDIEEQIARNLRDQLINWGYIPVELKKREANKYEVLLGAFLTEEEANRAKEMMQKDGLIISDIVFAGEKPAIALKEAEVAPEKRLYRVAIQEFEDERSALQLKAQMENEGFVALDVFPEAGKYRLFAGQFIQESEANKFAEYLKKEGYRLAQVAATRAEAPIEVAALPPTTVPAPVSPTVEARPTPEVVPAEITQREEWKRLTEEERQRVRDAIRREQMIRTGAVMAQEIEDLRKQLQQLSSAQKEIVQTVRQRFEEEERLKREVSKLFMDVDRAMDSQKWDEALAMLGEIEKIDPANARIDLKRRAIEMGKKNVKFEGQDILEEKFKREIAQARSSALEYEKLENFTAAISQWEIVKSKTEPTSFDYKEAARKIGELRELQRSLRAKEEAKAKRVEMVGYSAVGLIVVLLAIVLLILVRAKKRDRELLRQVQEIALKPLLELGEGRQLELPEKPREKPAGEEPLAGTTVIFPEEEKVEEAAPPEMPEEKEKPAELFPFAETPKPKPDIELFPPEGEEIRAETKPAVEEKPAEEIISVSPVWEVKEAAKEELKGEEEPIISDIETLLEGLEKEPVEKREEEIPELVSLESLLPPEVEEKKEAEVPKPEIAYPPEIKIVEEKEPPSIAKVPPVVKEEEKAPPVVEVTKIVYAQSFDDELVGNPPKNWSGKYDYASLIVTEETPAPNSTRCLKFEKKTGAGSAYYASRFPDVTGLVQVEFDLRCDEKNKYLLGVYIEKDGDFRQSIHTIIHRTEAQLVPTLRIHGEPVPYLFGSWRHIKYIIDLEEGTVDSYVDDKAVASRVRLANNPKRLNTISIRDNLATTGVLKLDNIQIVQL